MNIIYVKAKTIESVDGNLSVLESDRTIPFEIRRVYYIYGLKNHSIRGGHAHKRLNQVMFVINGSLDLKLETNDGVSIITLDKPDEGVFIGNMCWREFFNFSNNAIVMIFASEYYDESDYIRDYNQFKKMIGQDN